LKTATLLTHYLQTRTEFLNDTKLDEDEIVGGAILHQICQLICNANAISSVQSGMQRKMNNLTFVNCKHKALNYNSQKRAVKAEESMNLVKLVSRQQFIRPPA